MKTAALACRALTGVRVSLARGILSLGTWILVGSGCAIAGRVEAAEVLSPGHVVNISTRGRVGTGENVMIAGFVIVGESPRRVLVRVLGPSLGRFGVADPVVNPKFTIHPPNSSTVIAENDNWGDGDPAAVTATGLRPYDPLDCALVLDLPAGLYTAVVEDVGGPGGVALVEVFDLDHPQVAGTSPTKHVADVDATSGSVTVTFDRAMAPEVDMDPCAAWGASNYVWSTDHRQLTITRVSAAAPLGSGARVSITLNPVGGSQRMRDLAGNVLAPYTIAFTVGAAAGVPYVVSTVPEVGASVSADLAELVFTFSEPMAQIFGGWSSNIWPYTCSWSADRTVLYVRRNGTASLTPGTNGLFGVGPPYYTSQSGVPMDARFDLTFSVGADLQRIEADPARGFQWPYFLVMPVQVVAPATLLIEPNNTGTWGDNPAQHETSALALARNRASFANSLGCPLLVPAFPRPMNPQAPEPGGIYTHALDRFCLQMNGCPIERLDLQLLAMADDARARLATRGVTCDAKFFMTGFSASGAFTSRFSMLHPDRLKAAACGSPGGWPIAPVASWNGTVLPYPCGISDLAVLVGTPADVATFSRLPLFIYVGSVDTNDAYDVRGMSSAERTAIMTLLNTPQDPYIANRWPTAEAIYQSVGSVAMFRVYPGIGHGYSTEMINDAVTFFASHR